MFGPVEGKIREITGRWSRHATPSHTLLLHHHSHSGRLQLAGPIVGPILRHRMVLPVKIMGFFIIPRTRPRSQQSAISASASVSSSIVWADHPRVIHRRRIAWTHSSARCQRHFLPKAASFLLNLHKLGGTAMARKTHSRIVALQL